MHTLWPFFAIALLAVHLIAVQLASAAPIVCCLLPKTPNRPASAAVARRLGWHATFALIVGAVVGLLLGWLAMNFSSRDYSPVLTRFFDRVWWGGWELLFSLLVMLIYLLPWEFWRTTRFRRFLHGMLAIIAATNLLYHFPPLLTVMAEQMASMKHDLTPSGVISSPDYRGLIVQPLVIVKSLHFVFAAFAVSGAWLMWIDHTDQKIDGDERGRNPPARTGAIVAAIAIAIQMLLGMWLVMQVPAAEQAKLIGGDTIATLMLLIGVVLSLAALNQLGTIVMEGIHEVSIARRRFAAGLVFIVAVTMICVAGRTSGLMG